MYTQKFKMGHKFKYNSKKPEAFKTKRKWLSLQFGYRQRSLQFSSVIQSCLTLCDPMDCSTLGYPVHHQLLELAQTHVHWVSDTIQPSHSLSSPSPPAFNLSQYQGLLQWVSFRIGWPKYWSFSFSISPSNEYSELISFRRSLKQVIESNHKIIIIN